LEVPLKVLALPGRFVGTGYFLVELVVRGTIALTMLLDSGFTAAVMLTNRSCSKLGIATGSAAASKGIGAIGSLWMDSIDLVGAELRGDAGPTAVALGVLKGVVVEDFPQRKIGEEVGIAVDGMLGQGFLERCDLELDCFKGVLRAWKPKELLEHEPGWISMATLPLPGNLQGLLLRVPGGSEPVVGVVDTGASHTIVNSRAAEILGLQDAAELNRQKMKDVRGIGLGNHVLKMPLVSVVNATLCRADDVTIALRSSTSRSWSFNTTMSGTCRECVGPLTVVNLAVGDIGFFENLLSRPEVRFEGAVALLGQDLLAQRPLRLSGSSRRIWFQRL